MKYLLLAELGYEVAQSNAAYIMDRKETELYNPEEMWKRALVYWSRYVYATSICFLFGFEDYLLMDVVVSPVAVEFLQL